MFSEVIEAARGRIGSKCKACPVCNGLACRNTIPGPGAKGVGDVAIRNYSAWQNIRLNMDTICLSGDTDLGLDLFGRHFDAPFFAGPVGAVNLHYSDVYTDASYNDVLVSACAASGIAAFTGDGVDIKVMQAAAAAIKKAGGIGVPTIKPWDLKTIEEKIKLVESEADPFAIAMDIDAAGLPFLKGLNPPAGSKTVEELKEITSMTDKPFILKGMMTVKGALKACEAGVSGIVVSNHGGRVLDGCPATAEVLPEIADALSGTGVKIFVDGGIRSGVDIFRALAAGADAVIIARPFVTAVYGGAEEGVGLLAGKLKAELDDTMRMCGASKLAEIDRSMIRL